jgi:signal transduction histidine kinase
MATPMTYQEIHDEVIRRLAALIVRKAREKRARLEAEAAGEGEEE